MKSNYAHLLDAELKASVLFKELENRNLFIAGKTEKQLNTEVYNLAFEMYGIKKYWHKRIVRSGKNTLCPYKENPPDLILKEDDILFLDFGPVFENWEADFGRTYVLGNNPDKLKLLSDTEKAWNLGKEFYQANKQQITGSEFYNYTKQLAIELGWEYGNEHCGHLVGNFPHENLLGEERINYIHPDNHLKMSDPDKFENERFWIYEIHLVNTDLEIGGFFEQILPCL